MNGFKSEPLFHIAEPSHWPTNADHYSPASYPIEGFVHLSTRSQVLATAGRYYTGRIGLWLLAIDESLLPKSVTYENLLGAEELFPHYYGEIPCSAILEVAALETQCDGQFTSSLLRLHR